MRSPGRDPLKTRGERRQEPGRGQDVLTCQGCHRGRAEGLGVAAEDQIAAAADGDGAWPVRAVRPQVAAAGGHHVLDERGLAG
ncbi:hypothetical protein ACIOUE_23800 [Streptomyces xanthochromogenes]|uniref:hypothetical protein n=1 Tax=Streptomyces xanthochromogenes TaxID=67384 RepID=UPI0038036040